MARFPSQIIKAFHKSQTPPLLRGATLLRTNGRRPRIDILEKNYFHVRLKSALFKMTEEITERSSTFVMLYTSQFIHWLLNVKSLKREKKDCSYFTKRSPLTLWYIRHYVKWKFKISISLLTFTSLSWSSSSNFTSQAHESCPSTLPPWVGCILSNPFVYQVPCSYWTEGLYLLEQTEVHTQNNKNKKINKTALSGLKRVHVFLLKIKSTAGLQWLHLEATSCITGCLWEAHLTLTKKTYKFILLLLFKQTSFKLPLRKCFSPTSHLQKCSRSSLTSHLRRRYSPVTFMNPIGQPTGFVRQSVYWYLTASNAESNWLKSMLLTIVI